MNRVVADGHQGGKLMVNECGHVIAFFSSRYETGSSCQVVLGPVLDALLALKPGEHLAEPIDGIDDVYVSEEIGLTSGGTSEITVVILSSYWHKIDRIVISQDRLRQAARWACFGAQRDVAALQ